MKGMELLHICRPSTRRSMKISTHIWAMCLLLHFQWPIKTNSAAPRILFVSFPLKCHHWITTQTNRKQDRKKEHLKRTI